jgi:hypothetical protein
MKSKTLIRYILFSFTFFALTYSCSKNELSEKEQIQETVYAKDNIVHFKSMKDFVKTINFLHSLHRKDLATWEKDLGFSKSMRNYYEELQDPNNADIEDRWSVIPDPVFASIVNEQGVFVIGDTIHKITYNYEYLITDGDLNKLDDLEKSETFKSSTSNIIQIPIIRFEKDNNLKWVGWKTYEKTDICDLTNRRAQLKAWNVTYALYASSGIRIVGRQHIKNIWGNYDWKDWYMDYAKVDGCVRATAIVGAQSTGVYELCGSDEETDEKNVDKTLTYWAGTGVVINVFWVHANYYYEDGGCSKQWYQEFNN